jgi:hypothetical protein
LRLSIGIEALEDLREDLDDALARVAALQPLCCGGTSLA